MRKVNSINITIDTPCGQDFDTMRKTGAGNYCDACKTEVVDFTKMSDAQVLNYLESKSFNVACGKFRPNQLDRTMFNPVQEPFINWSKMRGSFYALFLLSFSFLKVSGQSKNTVQKQVSVQADLSTKKLNKVRIRIIDSVGNIIPNASVMVLQTGQVFTLDTTSLITIPYNSKEKNKAIGFQPFADGYGFVVEQVFPNEQGDSIIVITAMSELTAKRKRNPHVVYSDSGEEIGYMAGGIGVTTTMKCGIQSGPNLNNPPPILYKKKSFLRRLFSRKD